MDKITELEAAIQVLQLEYEKMRDEKDSEQSAVEQYKALAENVKDGKR